MTTEIGYPDSVAQDGGTHTTDTASPNGELDKFGNLRKEWAAPGNAGRSEDTTPIGPQSGFAPLASSQTPHGDSVTEASARKEWGTQ